MTLKEIKMLAWPFCALLALTIIPILIMACPFLQTLEILLLLPVFIGISFLVAGFFIYESYSTLGPRIWIRFFSALLLPIWILICSLNFHPLWSFWTMAGDQIHFNVLKSRYVEAVQKIPVEKSPKILFFIWGGLAGISSYGVVFDESDQVILPEHLRSDAWKRSVQGTELQCGVTVVPMGDHFYKAYTSC